MKYNERVDVGEEFHKTGVEVFVTHERMEALMDKFNLPHVKTEQDFLASLNQIVSFMERHFWRGSPFPDGPPLGMIFNPKDELLRVQLENARTGKTLNKPLDPAVLALCRMVSNGKKLSE